MRSRVHIFMSMCVCTYICVCESICVMLLWSIRWHSLFNFIFSSLKVIVGLSSGAVTRLKKTFAIVRSRKIHADLLDQMMELFTMIGNYKHYRRLVKSQEAPLIPFMGVFVSDLTFLDDGNQDFVTVKYRERSDPSLEQRDTFTFGEAKLINIWKRRKLAVTLRESLGFQSQKYALDPLPFIQRSLANPPFLRESDLYKYTLPFLSLSLIHFCFLFSFGCVEVIYHET